MTTITKLKVGQNNMKILVTGGHGFIAGYVIEELKRRGHTPVVTVRHYEKNPLLEDCVIYYTDIRDYAGVYGAVEHSDGVIHLAGLLGSSENIRQAKIMNDVNIDGALNILNACDNFHIPGVIIGVGNWFENNTYSISKTTAERYTLMYAKNFKTQVNVVRALNAIGPRQKWGKINKIIPTFINAALRNQDIKVYGGKKKCGIMDMIYVGDLARVLVKVLFDKSMSGDIGKIFEAGTGKGHEVYKIAEMVIRMTGSKSKIVEVPMRPGESERSIVVAKNPYPFEYRKLRDILKETIEYYRGLM